MLYPKENSVAKGWTKFLSYQYYEKFKWHSNAVGLGASWKRCFLHLDFLSLINFYLLFGIVTPQWMLQKKDLWVHPPHFLEMKSCGQCIILPSRPGDTYWSCIYSSTALF